MAQKIIIMEIPPVKFEALSSTFSRHLPIESRIKGKSPIIRFIRNSGEKSYATFKFFCFFCGFFSATWNVCMQMEMIQVQSQSVCHDFLINRVYVNYISFLQSWKIQPPIKKNTKTVEGEGGCCGRLETHRISMKFGQDILGVSPAVWRVMN